MDIKSKLERQAERIKAKIAKLELTHSGNEINLTYWGGFDMGYHRGKLSIIEDVLDLLNEESEVELKFGRCPHCNSPVSSPWWCNECGDLR